MITVAVTGGIGSGKTEVCRMLQQQGIPVYDADSRTKSLYDEDPSLVEAISRTLGADVRSSDGTLDRKLLAGMIFSDAGKLEALESVVHPRVLADFISWEKGLGEEPVAVIESAIFLQKPIFRPCADVVVLVDAPLETRIERACARDSADRQKIEARIASQQVRRDEADYIIENDSDIATLHDRVMGVLQLIKERLK